MKEESRAFNLWPLAAETNGSSKPTEGSDPASRRPYCQCGVRKLQRGEHGLSELRCSELSCGTGAGLGAVPVGGWRVAGVLGRRADAVAAPRNGRSSRGCRRAGGIRVPVRAAGAARKTGARARGRAPPQGSLRPPDNRD